MPEIEGRGEVPRLLWVLQPGRYQRDLGAHAGADAATLRAIRRPRLRTAPVAEAMQGRHRRRAVSIILRVLRFCERDRWSDVGDVAVPDIGATCRSLASADGRVHGRADGGAEPRVHYV